MNIKDFIEEYNRLDDRIGDLSKRISASQMDHQEVFRKANIRRMLKSLGLGAAVIGAGVMMHYAASNYAVVRKEEHAVKAVYVKPDNHIDDSAYLPEVAPKTDPEGDVSRACENPLGHDELLGRWKTAWETGVGYREMYHPDFVSSKGESLDAYIARKDGYQSRRKGSISVTIGNFVARTEKDKTCLEFPQTYRSSEYSDRGLKTLCIDCNGKIVSEDWRRR